MSPDLSLLLDSCLVLVISVICRDPARDPLKNVGDPCDPWLIKKEIYYIFLFSLLTKDHTDHPRFSTDHGPDHGRSRRSRVFC